MDLLAQSSSSFEYNVSYSSDGFLPVLLITLPLTILYIVAMWKVFQKAGEPGWAAIVPFYNLYVLIRIAGKPTNWFWIILVLYLIAIIPLLGFFALIAVFVMLIMVQLDIAKNFGKSTTFAIFGLIIFSFIGYLMLAFGDAEYKKVTNSGDAQSPKMPPADPGNPPESS